MAILKNRHRPAFPQPIAVNSDSEVYTTQDATGLYTGLSKLEYAVIQFAQSPYSTHETAVDRANALFDKLEGL